MMKKVALMLALIAALSFVIVSCSDDSSSEPSGPDTQVIPAGQQAAAASASAGQVNVAIGQVDNLGGGMTGSMKGKNPPADWVAVGNGWYKYSDVDLDDYFYDLKVKFTPDVWATGTYPNYDYDSVTKYEYNYSYNLDSTMVSEGYTIDWIVKWLWNAYAEWEDTGKTKIKGENNQDMLYKYTINYKSQMVYEYKYLWNLVYDGVSVDYNDKSAHFTVKCTWPYYLNEQTYEYSYTNLTGEFKFASNGAGILDTNDPYLAGWMKSNNVLFMKFYFDGTNGWYTIGADSFAAHTVWDPF